MNPLNLLRRYFALPALAAGAYWALDHLLPDLLPKVPRPVAIAIVIGSFAILLMAGARAAWKSVTRRFPLPWIPRPAWRIRYWLAHRPSLQIITAVPKGIVEGAALSECQFNITLQRNLTKLPMSAKVDFQHSEILLRGKRNGKMQTWHFRPMEAGGFLAEPVAPKTYDFVMVTYRLMALPMRPEDGPVFSEPYDFELRGVRAIAVGDFPLSGTLPPILWRWSPTYGASPMEPPSFVIQPDIIR